MPASLDAPGNEPDRAHPPRRRRLGEVLVEQGTITAEQLEEVLATQRNVAPGHRRRRLGALVVELGFASERQVAAALAGALNLDLIDLGVTPVSQEVTRLLPRAVAERHLALPIQRDRYNRLVVAFADPTNVVAHDDVKLYAGGGEIRVVVATETQVRDHIARAWSLSEDSSDVTAILEEVDEPEETPEASATEDAPTVKLVNAILSDAVRLGASDVHIEPQAGELRIRYRVDGLLRDVMNVPKSAAPGLVSRIKVMSNLDIAERRVPQDGRARLSFDNYSVDTRISTLPGIHGEKVVVRLLSRGDNVQPLAQLGMDEKQLDTLLGTLVAPQGLVLITGPTGSGKTNTLYSAIGQIKTPDRNIVTLEDPVEIQVAGITQVQVHERAGLTFARGLRSILRQDPDIVLVGEVRDAETAQLALEASLTGHLVLTTLHTNSAPAALTRLVEMGVEPYLVASSLSLVAAQRLVRRVCESCAAPYVPGPRVLTLLGLTKDDVAHTAARRGKGCSDCGGTGYRGRVGIFEVLPVTAALRAVLTHSPTEGAVSAAARSAGVATLRSAGLAKAGLGVTTFEEVLRVTQSDATGGLRCSNCGHVLDDDMVACPWCTTPVDRGHCSSCARPLEPDWRICPWCRTETGGGGLGSLHRATITPKLLVVEDDASVRAYVATTLAGQVVVDAVATAEEALAKLGAEEFDGVLVDNVLPDMSGTELLRVLRTEPATALVPLMMFTGHDARETESAARLAGADDYLVKPVDPMLLEERIGALVARSRRMAG